MYELVQAGPASYYIQCPAKIGIYVTTQNEAYLIDSGNDKSAGKKALKILQEQGWPLKAVINTHSNADHIGGNKYLQQQTGCKIFAGGIEGAFTEYPVLEPSFLYGGYPCKDLRHKFLMADKSFVTPFEDGDFPKELEIIPLPGHFFDMVGIRTPDNTIFLADCISSKETLEKYQAAFIYDVEKYLETLEKIKSLKADIFVPSHAGATDDIRELADFNRDKVMAVADRLLKICGVSKSFDDILKEIFDVYCLDMNFEQYVLVGSTIRSYLSWLRDTKKMDLAFEKNKLMWKTL